MNDSNYTHTCQVCNERYTPTLNKDGTPYKTKHKICSQKCRERHKLIGNIDRQCKACGATFRRRKRKNDTVLYCSRKCVDDKRTRVHLEREAIKRIGAAARSRARSRAMKIAADKLAIVSSERHLMRETAALTRIKAKASKQGRVRICNRCACKFIINKSGKLLRCNPCADEHDAEQKRSEKAKRKAVIRGANSGDNIDPVAVLKSFKWRCYICGVSTPKKLRGTYDDRAPEVDHIVPLSKGGGHVLSNLACACRKCNAEKSDSMPFLL